MKNNSAARNLLEFKDSLIQVGGFHDSTAYLHRVKDHQNLSIIGDKIRESSSTYNPKVIIHGQGISRKQWNQTLWALSSYFEHKYSYKVCLLGEDLDFPSEFEVIQEREVTLDDINLPIHALTPRLHLVNKHELRKILNEVRDVKKFNQFYCSFIKDYQVVIIGNRMLVQDIQRDSLTRVLLLDAESVSYMTRLNGTRGRQLTMTREFYQSYNLKECGVIVEPE